MTAAGAGPGWAARAAGRPFCRAGGAAGVSANGRGAHGRGAGRPAACGARAGAGRRTRRGGRSGAARRGARACGGAAWGAPPAVRRCGSGTRAPAATRRFFVAYDVDRAPDHLGPYLGGGPLKLSRGDVDGEAPRSVYAASAPAASAAAKAGIRVVILPCIMGFLRGRCIPTLPPARQRELKLTAKLWQSFQSSRSRPARRSTREPSSPLPSRLRDRGAVVAVGRGAG